VIPFVEGPDKSPVALRRVIDDWEFLSDVQVLGA
jgi:hypothetical protein